MSLADPTTKALQANAIFDYYEAAYPGSEVVASTLDDYYRELEQAAPNLHLPTHTEEIGDTWIYGDISLSCSVQSAWARDLNDP